MQQSVFSLSVYLFFSVTIYNLLKPAKIPTPCRTRLDGVSTALLHTLTTAWHTVTTEEKLNDTFYNLNANYALTKIQVHSLKDISSCKIKLVMAILKRLFTKLFFNIDIQMNSLDRYDDTPLYFFTSLHKNCCIFYITF